MQFGANVTFYHALFRHQLRSSQYDFHIVKIHVPAIDANLPVRLILILLFLLQKCIYSVKIVRSFSNNELFMFILSC